MKKLACLLLSIATYSADLIYVSDDAAPKNLEILSEKYKQPLLIHGNDAYLIPKACQLERYFGGISQGELKVTKQPAHTENFVLTQEIFDAKDEKEIAKKIEVEKSVAIAEGKVSKAFLEDKEGRGFGGASEVPLDFTFQKMEVVQNSAKLPSKEAPAAKALLVPKRPSCELLKDGSGYKIDSAADVRLYFKGQFTSVVNNTVLFQ